MRNKLAKFIMCFTLLLTIVQLQHKEAAAEDDLFSYAKKFIGTPYKFGGTSPSGFDCSGFTGYVFQKMGVDLPRTAASQFDTGMKVSKSELQPGDLVFFETYKSGPSHNGIYLGDGKFIHSSSSNGVSISSINDPYYWGDKYIGARRVANFSNSLFIDVPEDHWAYEPIVTVSEKGYIGAGGSDEFHPDQEVTRAQFAAILTKLLNLSPSSNPAIADVPADHWAYSAIVAFQEKGYMTLDSDNRFNPDTAVNERDMAVVLHRIQEDESITISSIDWENVNQYLEAKGITTESDNEVTRAQLAVYLVNLFGQAL